LLTYHLLFVGLGMKARKYQKRSPISYYRMVAPIGLLLLTLTVASLVLVGNEVGQDENNRRETSREVGARKETNTGLRVDPELGQCTKER
jgi:hypothetical protein